MADPWDWDGAKARSAPATKFDPEYFDYIPLVDTSKWAEQAPPERQWALLEWIPKGQATYLTGPGSAGKSLLGQQLCTSLALGRRFMGIETQETIALYLTAEDDAAELQRRQRAICNALGVKESDLGDYLQLASLAGHTGSELATFDERGRIQPTERYHALKSLCLLIGCRFVVLDNVAHFFAGNENSRHEVAAFVGLINQLAIEIDGSVLFLGHPNKAGDSFSGSTAWENQVRSRLFLETPKDEDGFAADPDMRVLSRQKSNYARNGEQLKFRWHHWAFVREEDLPVDVSAGIAVTIQASTENARFLECLAKATAEKRATSASRSASNYAPRIFAKMPTAKGIGIKGFEAALQRLLHLGQIVNGQPVYQRDNRTWATGLGLAQTLAQTPHKPCAQQCTDTEPNDAESLHNGCTNLHALTPSILRIEPARSLRPPAPVPESEAALARTDAPAFGTVLAAFEMPDPADTYFERPSQ